MTVSQRPPNLPTNSPSTLPPETLVNADDDARDDRVTHDELASDAVSVLLRRRLESSRSSPTDLRERHRLDHLRGHRDRAG